ncbi:ATP-grasp domain-containing protein [Nonomuraea insulae]|uniref:ATP-grasp domain-containing protein n=1 Tax=Nonomuraea insulae TaxID=1616787 RepID=A0ABW1CR92_9ACTN
MTRRAAVVFLYRESKPLHREILEDFARAARDAGCLSFCLAPRGTPLADAPVDGYRHYDPGPGHEEVLAGEVSAIAARHPVLRLLSTTEHDVELAAALREHAGIKGLRPEHSVHFRDKDAMTARVAELGIATASWAMPHTLGTIERFAREVGYPLVLKPYDGISCRGTHKVRTRAELGEVWGLIRDRRHDYRAESFVAGEQYHVDILLREGEVLFEAVSRYTHTLLDNYHDYPVGSVALAGAPAGPHNALLDAARAVVTGLGMRTGVTHTEFFLRQDGSLVFGETAARMPGAWAVPMYRAAFGISLPYVWARSEIDPDYRPDIRSHQYAGGWFLVSGARGRISRISSARELMTLPDVVDAQVWRAPGDHIDAPSELGGQNLGYAVVTGDSPEDVAANLGKAHELFTVVAA